MVRELIKKRVQGAISIQKDGTISISQPIMDRLGYKDGDTIVIAITEAGPLSIGLRVAKPHETDRDYTLGYLYKSTQMETSGGKVTCTELSNELKAIVTLPQRAIAYGVPPNWKYNVLLLPDEIEWQEVDFVEESAEDLANKLSIYRLTREDGVVLYIGEGKLRQRFRKHLQNKDMTEDVAYLQYISITRRSSSHGQISSSNEDIFKDDAVFLQKQLLGIHFEEFDALPKYNSRWY